MERQIKLINRPSYGNDRYFPDCELSRLLCQLLGKKTLADSKIAILKAAGYVVVIQNQPQGETIAHHN